MIITYHGLESFKIQLGATTLALNPIAKESKHKSTSFGADIVLVSVNHPDMNGVSSASRGEAEPFVIAGAGEYEVSDVFVRGFGTATRYGGAKRNTAYTIRLEGMRLCYLGALGTPELPADLEEAVEEVDVLFVPVGASGVLSPKDAHRLAVYLEPKVVIPMYHDTQSLAAFLKEEGEQNGEQLEKLTIKPKDVAGKSGEVVVLKAV